VSDENVIEFPGSTGELATPKNRRHELGACRHRFQKKLVDRDRRRVVCDGCAAELDAMDVLIELADDHVNRRRTAKSLQKEIDQAAAKLEETKKEERKAKARLRNAKRKDLVIEERRRIMGLIDTALQNFAEWEARELAHDRAEGILRGFSEVVRGLFDESEVGSFAGALLKRIDAAHQELGARRRRRGESRTGRKRPTSPAEDEKS
jgi:hypothetical protein